MLQFVQVLHFMKRLDLQKSIFENEKNRVSQSEKCKLSDTSSFERGVYDYRAQNLFFQIWRNLNPKKFSFLNL